MLLHGTLRKYGQWVDECGMLSFGYDVIVELRKRRNKTTNYLYFVALIGSYFMLVKFHFFVLLFWVFNFTFTYYQINLIKIRGESINSIICRSICCFDGLMVFGSVLL